MEANILWGGLYRIACTLSMHHRGRSTVGTYYCFCKRCPGIRSLWFHWFPAPCNLKEKVANVRTDFLGGYSKLQGYVQSKKMNQFQQGILIRQSLHERSPAVRYLFGRWSWCSYMQFHCHFLWQVSWNKERNSYLLLLLHLLHLRPLLCPLKCDMGHFPSLPSEKDKTQC